MEVFLGGTTNNSSWRDSLIPMLNCDYFNPVVENWNEEAQQNEILKRKTCDILLYVITPKMIGVYAVAEAVYDACNRPEKTIFCVLKEDDFNEWTEAQLKSLEMTKQLIEDSGAKVCEDLNDIANYINYKKFNLDKYLDYK